MSLFSSIRGYLEGVRAFMKRKLEEFQEGAKEPQPAPPRLCAFGFVNGTDQPEMVGSIRNDTIDWQPVLILDAGDVINLPSVTLLIRHAPIPRQAPIDHNLKDHLEFSLQWPLFDFAKEKTVMIYSMDLSPFDLWYTQATSTIQALPVLQQIRSDSNNRSLTVIECLMGSLPSFQHFPDFRSWNRLPNEVKTQLLKARDGLKIITFVVDAKNEEISRTLIYLREQIKSAADSRTFSSCDSVKATTNPPGS